MTDTLATIRLPHEGWKPRPHQRKLWRYMVGGGKRAVAVWHRRCGKDEVMLHATAVAMFKRPANYWHALPAYTMARRAVWDAINPHTGRKRIDECFPHEMRESTRDQDMKITFHNHSTWSVVGSDTVTSGGGIGSSVAGIVFSEYALANPSAWAYYRPILEENNGWAAFISTPRGRNHFHSLYQHAEQAPGWFAERLTVRDTSALTPEAIAETMKELHALYGEDQGRAMFEQEMMCSWTASTLGSFYALEMASVREEGRITEDAEPDLARPVHRSWDLGVGDDTSVWWFQPQQSGQVYILDHLANSGVGVDWWRDAIFAREQERGWIHGDDYVPHDANVREFGTGRTRVETMASIGLKPMPVPWAYLDDGINAVRRTLPLCVFHPRCEEGGITALEGYRRDWDDEKKAFKPTAVHDWTSHPADSFRYLAMAYKAAPPRVVKQRPPLQTWQISPPVEPRRGGIIL